MNGPLKITLGILAAAVLFGGGLMTGQLWLKAPSEPLPVPDRAGREPVASPLTNSQETATKPRYQATTVFQINKSSAPEIFPAESGDGNTSGATWFEAQVKALTARNTLMLAGKNLKLETKWKLPPGEAVGKLERLTEVEQERGTDIVSLSAWSDSAEEAVTIANGVRDAYAQRRREAAAERVHRLTETVAAQIRLQEATVEKSRLEILELMKKHNIKETSQTPSEFDAAELAAEQQKHPEYVTRHYPYESQVRLLNTMRDHPERLMQEAVTRNPIEILETAVAVKNP